MLEIKQGAMRAVVDTHGAWICELSYKDTPVFYPRQQLTSESGETKTRGGCHVCLPNFGPGGDSELPQHGFGRLLEWSVVASASHQVTLALGGEPNTAYQACETTLTYTVGEGILSATLAVTNKGSQAFRIAPAFHPYFQVAELAEAVKINEQIYDLSMLAEAEFLEVNDVTLTTNIETIRLSQQNLPTWAIWSDRLGNYVCIEPTYGGYRFLETEQPDERLEPGQNKVFQMHIALEN